MASLRSSEPAVVAVTGPMGEPGGALAARLAARGVRVLALGPERPESLAAEVEFRPLDLLEPAAHERLAELCSKEGVEAIAHTAFRSEPTPDRELDRELDVIGSLHVMNACAAAKVARLVVASSTLVYGPWPDNPNFLDEEHPLRGHPEAHAVQDRIEVEHELERFRARHPGVEVSVLRCPWVLGPRSDTSVSRYFSLPVVPVPMGYDPLLQLLHEDDRVDAFEAALLGGPAGVYNVVAPGVLPLSTLLRLAGQRSLPLPAALLDRLAYIPSRSRTGDPPAAFYDYLRHLWVADGSRGWEALGTPSYSTKETWMSFVSARRMRRYR